METTNVEFLKNLCELSSRIYLQGVMDANHIQSPIEIEEIIGSQEIKARINDKVYSLKIKQYETLIMETAKVNGLHYIFNFVMNVFPQSLNDIVSLLMHHIYKLGLKDHAKWEIYNNSDIDLFYMRNKTYCSARGYVDLDTYCSILRKYLLEIQLEDPNTKDIDLLDHMIVATIKNKNEIAEIQTLNEHCAERIRESGKISD